MEIRAYEDLAAFSHATSALFRSDAIRHTVALIVLERLAAGRSQGEAKPLLVSVTEDGAVIGAAVSTRPWPITLSALPASAIQPLVGFLARADTNLCGATGPCELVKPFADAWAAISGRRSRLSMEQRFYRLKALAAPEVAGSWRWATRSEIPMLVRWRRAIQYELDLPGRNARALEEWLGQELAEGKPHAIWDEGGVAVSYAAASTPGCRHVAHRAGLHTAGTPRQRVRVSGHRCGVPVGAGQRSR